MEVVEEVRDRGGGRYAERARAGSHAPGGRSGRRLGPRTRRRWRGGGGGPDRGDRGGDGGRVTVALVEQPYRVAGKRSRPPRRSLTPPGSPPSSICAPASSPACRSSPGDDPSAPGSPVGRSPRPGRRRCSVSRSPCSRRGVARAPSRRAGSASSTRSASPCSSCRERATGSACRRKGPTARSCGWRVTTGSRPISTGFGSPSRNGFRPGRDAQPRPLTAATTNIDRPEAIGPRAGRSGPLPG